MALRICCLFAGLVAQQQCVGPLQLPLADVAVFAQSHQNLSGAATSIGEQPLKGLINPQVSKRRLGSTFISCWLCAHFTHSLMRSTPLIDTIIFGQSCHRVCNCELPSQIVALRP